MHTAIKDLRPGDVVRIEGGKRANILSVEPAPFMQTTGGNAVTVQFELPSGESASEIANSEDKLFKFTDED